MELPRHVDDLKADFAHLLEQINRRQSDLENLKLTLAQKAIDDHLGKVKPSLDASVAHLKDQEQRALRDWNILNGNSGNESSEIDYDRTPRLIEQSQLQSPDHKSDHYSDNNCSQNQDDQLRSTRIREMSAATIEALELDGVSHYIILYFVNYLQQIVIGNSINPIMPFESCTTGGHPSDLESHRNLERENLICNIDCVS